MRKFLIAVLLMLGVLFVIGRSAELHNIVMTLRRGDWRFITLAFVAQIAWMFNSAASFRAIYRALGIEEKIETLLLMISAANFTNVIAPSGGFSGMAVFLSEARRRNYSPGRVTVAGALFILSDYLGFLCVLALGIVVLIRRDDLSAVEITASAILVAIAAILAMLLYLGSRSAEALGRVLAWAARLVNRLVWPFIHRQYLSEQRAHEFAHDAAEGLLALKDKPKAMLLPAALALTNKTFLVLILTNVFLAFKVPISIGTVIAGFSIAYLFLIVSPTPAGIGFVEGTLTLALHSMYVSLEDSAVITLAYRGITFWLPLLFGMSSFRLMEHVGEKAILPASKPTKD